MQPSIIEEGFAVVLGRMLAETHTSVRRLEHLSGVSRRTVENWLHGAVRGPRHWEPVLRVSQALHLSAAETDALLASAGLPRLAALQKATLTPAQSELLMRWQAPDGVMVPGRKAADGSGRHNIPASSTGFVGRVELLESLKR